MIYFDNNATTRPAPEVVAAVHEAMASLWANPSSVHRFGQQVRQRIELAREQVCALLHCDPAELVFTSGGTESANLAVQGTLTRQRARGRNVIISTPIEHAAIREPLEHLDQTDDTAQVEWLPVDHNGDVAPDALREVMQTHTGKVALVSIQWANNETGTIQDIDELVATSKDVDRRAVFHTDATQWVGKMTTDLAATPVDLLTFAGHKFHGPKGIGGLFIRRGVRVYPVQRGGPHERERRGGTEYGPGIIGLGVAAELAQSRLDLRGTPDNPFARVQELRDRFESEIVESIPECSVNGATARHGRLFNTSNIAFHRLEAEALLLLLSEGGVCASAGAACSSGSLDPSPVLLAMGIDPIAAHGSVRFSLSVDTTESEVGDAIEITRTVVARLRKVLPVDD